MKDIYIKIANLDNYEKPKYKEEDEWWTADDILEELKKRGVNITLQRLGRIARRYGKIKGASWERVYHRDIIETILTEHRKENKKYPDKYVLIYEA